ncbi:MAG: hypothetical protein EB127_30415, partial [Alphaproteobacteria bacterium]|nr:hypothetical protein [Alphaproteobacteria bacterium]
MLPDETLETIFTSIVLEPVFEVDTPVIMPFKYPLNVDVDPLPASVPETEAVRVRAPEARSTGGAPDHAGV